MVLISNLGVRFEQLLLFAMAFTQRAVGLAFSLTDVIFEKSNRDRTVNQINPTSMSASERLAELAEILATGLMRLRARQSTPLVAHRGDSSLDSPANPSSHANVLTNGALK
jgi:hypothetical protein